MIQDKPFSFLLVENAVVKHQNHPPYAVIAEEVETGRLQIDPATSHEGVWLLDAAIKARLYLNEGPRKMAEQRGADPAMDALWAQWARSAPDACLGDLAQQAARQAKLIRLGCSQSLHELIKRKRFEQNEIAAAWIIEKSNMLSDTAMEYVIRSDYMHTLSCLLANGYRAEDKAKEKHPLAIVKSGECAELLLRYGIDHSVFEGAELIDLTATRDIPVQSMTKIMQVLERAGNIPNPQEDKLARLAKNLEKKTKDQFLAEADIAGWSPVLSRQDFSPVEVWSRSVIGNPQKSAINEGAILGWLKKQSSHGKLHPGQTHSDAKLAWACLFASEPFVAEEHAKIAQDLPEETMFQRLVGYRDFLKENNVEPEAWVAKAMSSILQGYYWKDQEDLAAARFFDECMQAHMGKSWIVANVGGGYSPPHIDNLFTLGERIDRPMHAMSIALALCSPVHNASPRNMELIQKAWQSGNRPVFIREDIEALSAKMALIDPALSAEIENWALGQETTQQLPSRVGLRL